MIFALGLLSVLWFSDNAEFVTTMSQQQADGHFWKAIQCREVDPNLPAITIDTPTGKSLVCHKLVK